MAKQPEVKEQPQVDLKVKIKEWVEKIKYYPKGTPTFLAILEDMEKHSQ